MRTATRFLFALICIVLISAIFTPVLAADSPGYIVAIPPRFDGYAGKFCGGLAVVQNGGKSGLIDKAGNVIVPFDYDSIYYITLLSDINFSDNYFIAVRNGKWGIIDKSGKLVIPLEYDSVFSGGTGFAIVGKGRPVPPGGGAIDGLWGLYDLQTGKEILPVKYKSISPSDDALLYTVNLENKTGVTDRAGKFIVPIGTYDFISNYNSGYAMVQKNGKWGFIDKTGKIVVPVIYDDFPNRFYNGIGIARKGNRVGVISNSGSIVIPFIYDDGTVYSNGVISLRRESKITIIDKGGKVIAPAGKYNSVYAVEGNLIYVARGGKVGAIDMTGKEIVPFIYTGVRETKNGLAIVTANDRCAVINQSGKIILPLAKYGGVNLHDDGSILVVSTNYKQGLKDYNGNTILKYEYTSIGNINNGYVVAGNQQGMALFNKDGDMIVPFGEFEYIDYHISENLVGVRKNGLSGYIMLPEYVTPPDVWAKPEVDRAIAAGLVPEDLRKNYQDNITRADFCRLAVNLIEVKSGMKVDAFMNTRGMSGRVSAPISFTDTEDPYVLAASRLGIVNGVGNNKFDPTGKITRQDAAVMLRQTAIVLDFTEPNGTSVSFADSNKFAYYAVDAIAFVSAATDKESGTKVMGGTGNNNFSPLSPYTRQQAYITLLRLFNAMR